MAVLLDLLVAGRVGDDDGSDDDGSDDETLWARCRDAATAACDLAVV